VSGSDVGTVSGASTGVQANTFSPPIILEKGLYWVGVECSSASTLALRAYPINSLPNIIGEATTMGSTALPTCYLGGVSFGALPHNYPNSNTVGIATPPIVLLRQIG